MKYALVIDLKNSKYGEIYGICKEKVKFFGVEAVELWIPAITDYDAIHTEQIFTETWPIAFLQISNDIHYLNGLKMLF